MACQYDGGDCSRGVKDLWKDCLAPINGVYCSSVFNDGKCDEACNSERCLFDGQDCKKQEVCNPSFKSYCELHYSDGNCDQGCNNAGCNWDGNDCTNVAPMNHLKGSMVIFVRSTLEEFMDSKRAFLRDMGKLLRLVVKIKKDANGIEMIKPWSPSNGSRRKRSVFMEDSNLFHRSKRSVDISQATG